jgi:putative intracellular protease/amidase
MRTEILIFDGFDELDAFGPYEVLAGPASRMRW